MLAKIRTLKEKLSHCVLNTLSREEFVGLLAPKRHMPMLSGQRAGIIGLRVRLWAVAFAVLTLLWTIVDIIVFPWPTWGILALGRLACVLALAYLALSYPAAESMRKAHQGLLWLLVISVAFFVFSFSVVRPFEHQGAVGAVAVGYTFLPYLILAGLSVFPLTLAESLLFSLPVFAGVWLASAFCACSDPTAFYAMVWLMALILSITVLAGMGQLAAIIAFLRQATRDSLTGVYTRASGIEMLEIQFILAMRNHTPLTVAFLDIDDFRKVNEGYGHEAGDAVLVEVARRIRTCLRTGDLIVRWNGEEFLLVFPNTSLNNAYIALERLVHGGFGLGPDGAWVTASVGIAERQTDTVDDWRVLVDLAESRMREAQGLGKNRMVSPGLEYISI